MTEAGACVLRMETPICHMISKQENICLQTWHGSFSRDEFVEFAEKLIKKKLEGENRR